MQFHLDQQERQVLVSELFEIAVAFDVPALMKQLLAPNAQLLAQYPAGTLPNLMHIENAIGICCRSGYDLTPPALLAFLDYLLANGKQEADRLLRTRLLTPPRAASAGHPLEAELLYDRLPFADRAHLRQILREMTAEDSLRKILHIEGDLGSGRSWTSQLIEFHCSRSEGLLHCEGAVTEDNGAATGPRELARDLATKLGADPSGCPPPLSNEEAHLKELAQWVINAANEPQPHLQNNRWRVWFVFDGFNARALRDDTARFLVELARQCTSGVAARMHRVVFCEFDYDIASRIRLKVESYRTEPVSLEDLRPIVRSVIAANAAIPEADREAVIDETLRMVTENAPGPFADLSGVGARLQQIIEESRA